MKIENILAVSCFAYSFCCLEVCAQQTDEEMLAEAQRKLNAEVFGVRLEPEAPAKSELELYIENASANNLQPRTIPPNYWRAGYICEDIQSQSYIDYRDCMYFYHVYGRYWDVQQVVVSVSPTVVHKKSSRTIEISSYDEDALEDYYNGLKAAVKFLGPISSVTKENLALMKSQSGLGSLSSVWNMMIAQMDAAKIELDEWPEDTKQKGWDILGERIIKYNKMFESQRAIAIKNEALEQSVRQQIANFELLTNDNF